MIPGFGHTDSHQTVAAFVEGIPSPKCELFNGGGLNIRGASREAFLFI